MSMRQRQLVRVVTGLALLIAASTIVLFGRSHASQSIDAGVPSAGRMPDSPAAQAVIDDVVSRFQYQDPHDRSHATTRRALGDTVADYLQQDGPSITPHFATPSSSKNKTSITMPSANTGTVEFGESHSGVSVSISLNGATGVAGEAAGGYLVYRSGHSSGAHVIQGFDKDSFQDYLYFVKAPATPEVSYDIILNTVSGVRHVGNTVEFLDSRGFPRLAIAAPLVVDSKGTKVPGILSVTGCQFDQDPRPPFDRAVVAPNSSVCTVHVRWDDSTLVYPALLDPTWTNAGNNMHSARYGHGIAFAGKLVLVVAGDAATSAACEVFDPSQGDAASWATTGSLQTPRFAGFSVTPLPGTGTVLVAGGYDSTQEITSSEVYSPTTGTWTLNATSHMNVGRDSHTATYVSPTQILITGGYDWNGNSLSSCELYNPQTSTWSSTPPGNLVHGRAEHGAALIGTSKVLVAGGSSLSSSEVYDFSAPSPQWTVTSNSMTEDHGPTAIVMNGGTVLAVGGGGRSSDIFDPRSMLWSAGPTLPKPPGMAVGFAEASMSNGGILLAGGHTFPCFQTSCALATAYIYDPASNSVVTTASMTIARQGAAAIELPDKSILMTGGERPPSNTPLASVEVLTLGNGGAACTSNLECLSGQCSSSTCSAVPCTSNSQCTTGYYCGSAGCVPKLPLGVSCGTSGAVCSSGNCVDGVCCDTACGGQCDACNVAGHEGTCTFMPAGSSGNPSCSPLVCNGASAACPGSCSTDADCIVGDYCSSGTCTPKLANGTACTTVNQCQSGFCAQGYCCNTACDGGALTSGTVASCEACNVAGHLGACYPNPPGSSCTTVPVEPSTVVTQPQSGVATSLASYASIIYGTSGIQTDQSGNPISASVFDSRRAAVIHGHVRDSGSISLPDITVSILGHPEYGRTLSRTDGSYDMVVNGGGLLTVSFSGDGFALAQRQVTVPNQAFTTLDDVDLLPYSAATSVINLDGSAHFVNGAAPAGDPNTPARTTNLFFPPGAAAQITYDTSANCTAMCPGTCSGVTCTPSHLTMHTPLEFTQSVTDTSMPGTLPATSGYTFAADITADESLAVGTDGLPHATALNFTGALSTYPLAYTDDFLGLPQRMGSTTTQVPVPVAAYSFTSGTWNPILQSDEKTTINGQIIDILSVAGGTASVDTDGDGVADNSLGMSTQELQQLATWYSTKTYSACTQDSQCSAGGGVCVNSTCGYRVWRTPLPHFSSWDMNWGISPPSDATSPTSNPGVANNDDNPNECQGSIIECQNQVLGETVPVPGTRFTLNYRSSRVPDFTSSRTINIPLKNAPVPPSTSWTIPSDVVQVFAEISIAGRVINPNNQSPWSAASVPNQISWTWDGKDVYGKQLYGRTTASVRVGYSYPASYSQTAKFGYNGGGLITSIGGKSTPIHEQNLILWTPWRQVDLEQWNSQGVGLGGWDFNVHHTYDPFAKVLYLGDGHKRSYPHVQGGILSTTAGGPNHPSDFNPNAFNQYYTGIVTSTDGSVFAADSCGYGGGTCRIRKIDINGVLSTFVDMTPYMSGTSILGAMAIAPDNTLYVEVGTGQQVDRITPTGTVTVFAGTNACSSYTNPPDDGKQASTAQICDVRGMAYSPDGSLYLAEGGTSRIRRITPDGIIQTVLGPGSNNTNPNGNTNLGGIGAIAVAPDGTLDFYSSDTIYALSPQGLVSVVGGSGSGSVTDGVPATSVHLGILDGIAVGIDGSIYFDQTTDYAVHRIDTYGTLWTVGGSEANRFSCSPWNDGSPAVGETFHLPMAMAIRADGGLYVTEAGCTSNAIRFITPSHQISPMPDLVTTTSSCPTVTYTIASEDGSELYGFDSTGRHCTTTDFRTGAAKYTFAYTNGLLSSITENDVQGTASKVTTITQGSPSPITIKGPFGHTTSISLDNNNFASVISLPTSGQNYEMQSTAGGLLLNLIDPKNQEHIFTYDTLGRLVGDRNPAGGIQKLANGSGPSVTADGWSETVTRTTAANHATTYSMQPSGDGVLKTTTYPTGLVDSTQIAGDSSFTLTSADGSTYSQSLSPDPRFGLQSPIITETSKPTYLSSPMTVTRSRTAQCGTCSGGSTTCTATNLLGLMSQTDTMSVNGVNHTVTYQQTCPTGSGSTITVSTPSTGRTRTLTYNASGQLTAISAPGLYPLNLSYDSFGYLSSATMGCATGCPGGIPDQRSITWAYHDPLPPSACTTGTYCGQPSSVTLFNDVPSAGNLVTTFDTYDASTRLLQTTLPGSRVVGFTPDANGNLSQITVPGTNTHAFTYDGVDGLATYTPPLVNTPMVTRYIYNSEHQLSEVGRPDGDSIYFSYDGYGRLNYVAHPNDSFSTSYDSVGRVSQVVSAAGEAIIFGYCASQPCTANNNIGSMPRDITWSGPVSGSVHHDFDSFVRLSSETVTGGSTIGFTYDDDGFLCASATGSALATCTTTAPAGALKIHHADSTDTAPNGLLLWTQIDNLKDTYSYSTQFPEVTDFKTTYVPSMTTEFERSYDTRDKLGRIRQVTDNGDIYVYGYDSAGRLASVTKNNVVVESYTYDSNGNRATATNTINPASALSSAPTYDAQDRLVTYPNTSTVSYSYTYTQSGERLTKTVTGVGTTTYTYDGFGNLVSVLKPDGHRIDYVIDGQNRRVGKKIDGTLVQGFIYDDELRIVAELNGSNAVVSQFVYATSSNVPDYMIRGGVTYRLIKDHLGSVRLVLKTTDGTQPTSPTSAGVVLAYDVFGNVDAAHSNAFTAYAPAFQPFGFAGGLYDYDTGLIRFGRRDYDPQVGRWVSKDSSRFDGGDTNLYAYVANDPLNQIDPTGLKPGDVFATAEAAAIDTIRWIWKNKKDWRRPKVEYSGYVVETDDHKYMCTMPHRQDGGHSNFGGPPPDMAYGHYHTHFKGGGEGFGPGETSNQAFGWAEFLGTPSQHILENGDPGPIQIYPPPR